MSDTLETILCLILIPVSLLLIAVAFKFLERLIDWLADQKVDTSKPMPDFTPGQNEPLAPKFTLPKYDNRPQWQKDSDREQMRRSKEVEWQAARDRAIRHQRQAATLKHALTPFGLIKLLQTGLRALEEKTRPDPS